MYAENRTIMQLINWGAEGAGIGHEGVSLCAAAREI